MKKEINWDKKILAYSLKNAIEHEGKAQEGSVISSLFHEGLEKDKVREVMPRIKEILKSVNRLKLEEQKKQFESIEKEISHREEREGLPELPNAEKGVVMRLAPSSSAPAFHIGHILTGMPTSLYVKKYGGKFYLRIEDTNPEKTSPECYKTFPEEAKWIFGNVTNIIIQSDRIPVYYKYAEKLIEKGFAYVCTCDSEDFKKLVEKRKACSCRQYDSKEQMKRWKKMFKGFKEGQAVLRFKSDLTLNNPALIDFPLARINEAKHPRQEKKYRVWPLMNLAVAVDDMEEKMTHIIRAKEHQDNAKRQEMIFKVFNKSVPWTAFLGRYKFTDLELSKTKITERIKKGEFSGWDDIKLPMARNLRKRGYQPEAFAKMAEERGLNPVDKVISRDNFFAILDNFNREILKKKAHFKEFSSEPKENTTKISILMPDGKITEGYSPVDRLKQGAIVHFYGLGYARLENAEESLFWFCHR